MAIWVALAIIVILVLYVVSLYNRLVKLNIRSDEAWSDIEVQLKRRYDLIPNLIETVKGYAKHEKGVFEKVTEARANALGAEGIKEKGAAENQIKDALKSIFAVAEAYPDLKANKNFEKLQDELTDTEDKIQAARRFYNANVRDLNISVDSFPANMMAKQLGFKKKELFDLKEVKAEEPVNVKFDDK